MAKTKAKESAAVFTKKVKPLGDRVLVKEMSNEEKAQKTASGIYIPDTVKEDKGAKRGTVVAAGPGRYDDGKLVPMNVKAGDDVLYQWGDTVKIDGEEYVIVSESNLIAIIK